VRKYESRDIWPNGVRVQNGTNKAVGSMREIVWTGTNTGRALVHIQLSFSGYAAVGRFIRVRRVSKVRRYPERIVRFETKNFELAGICTRPTGDSGRRARERTETDSFDENLCWMRRDVRNVVHIKPKTQRRTVAKPMRTICSNKPTVPETAVYPVQKYQYLLTNVRRIFRRTVCRRRLVYRRDHTYTYIYTGVHVEFGAVWR